MEKPVFDLLVEISEKDFLDLTDNSGISNRNKVIFESERQRKLNYLLNQGLITRTEDIYIVTEYGFLVSQYKSWPDYLKHQKEAIKKRDLKETLDLKISEFQVRTKFLPYWVSLFSIVISIVALFDPFETEKQKTNSKPILEQKQKKSNPKNQIQKDSLEIKAQKKK